MNPCPEEHEQEINSLRHGMYIAIENKDKDWWLDRQRRGFFILLEEMDEPVKVVSQGRTFYFGSGLDRKTVQSFIRSLQRTYA